MASPTGRPDFALEAGLQGAGYVRVAGVDEAGRGPLAGPVVAAAVVFEDGNVARAIADLTDSKQLTPATRDRVYAAIVSMATSWAAASIDADEIDRINILQASLKAMAQAVERLDPSPDCLLIDGTHAPTRYLGRMFPGGVECLVKGDSRSLSVAAASVVAKVTRDRAMVAYDALYPNYGFSQHKGYPSPDHRRAIALNGVCPIHRRTFRGVREHCG